MTKSTCSAVFVVVDKARRENSAPRHLLCNLSMISYTLRFLKNHSRIRDVYCLTNSVELSDFIDKNEGKALLLPDGDRVGRDVDQDILLCIEKTAAEESTENILFIRSFSDVFFRYSLDDFLAPLCAKDSDLAFSAVEEGAGVWKFPAPSSSAAESGNRIEPLDAFPGGSLLVKETGELYACNVAEMKRKKNRFDLRAKAVLPLHDATCGSGCPGKEQPGGALSMEELAERLDCIQHDIRQMDGTVKCFLLSQGSWGTTADSRFQRSVFPNAPQRFLIFFHAYFVRMVGGKTHYDRLKDDPAAFFLATRHPLNLLFLKFLCLVGPKPGK